ncbi:formate dehydrogenase subunit gamma [Ancylobacter sonchi]|uniref:formate dehydrogenase subunit gamma n=1 Tax=Ancylobacter sonchi TaxID=1937790 RepID=UPI001BD57A5F|nr:formate dehydrogenase subunit gamma [Ancylobacter sonchi]MBS7535820.1 formate dehydrogenase subunit gamma [Ancylobacter sonchi]
MSAHDPNSPVPTPADDVQSGDAVHPGHPVTVDRYTLAARINHWITAVSLVLLALSGLALFTPRLFFLTGLFGGGQNTRILHPWIGVVLFCSFALLFIRFWRANLPKRVDAEWLARSGDMLAGREEKMPEVGKYNAGQKFVFWSMSALILVLITSGIVMWDQYFYPYTTIEQKRIAILVHSATAIFAICVWIVHVYAAIWVKGTFSAMTRGRVTGGWAWRHHRKWLRELVGKPTTTPTSRGTGTPAE